jgi:hypothetical protein
LGWIILAGSLTVGTSPGVIFHSTDAPTHNTSPPTGELADSGWELQGRWRSFLGTPIAPNLFLTAKHVGGGTNDLFHFRGTSYTVIQSFADSQSDLRIFKICGVFPAHAEIYTASDELGKTMVVFGRGTRRGAEVIGDTLTGTGPKGWRWGTGDGVLRWGTNQVSTVAGAIEGLGDLLGAEFNAGGGMDECHLSSGDSGGGIFIQSGAVWKLAGINYAVDGPFNTSDSGPGFNAALFDIGGLYETNAVTGGWDYQLPTPVADTPSAFYATRISANLTWINSIIAQHAVESYTPVLESTVDLDLPFAEHPDYLINESSRTIQLGVPASSLYLRLNGCKSHELMSIEVESGDWMLQYDP